MTKQVLFLCSGNSARSQTAEGWVTHDLGDVWQAYSAGTKPVGYVHPLAVEAMAERGIEISQQRQVFGRVQGEGVRRGGNPLH